MTIPIRQALADTHALLGQHPELGRKATVARAELVGPLRTRVRVGRHSFETDEAEVAGGQGSAPSPVQVALGAVAGCLVVTFRYWSELLELPLDGIAVEVRGVSDAQGFLGFDPAAPAGLTGISVLSEIRGPRPASRYRELHDAATRHCPLLVAFGDRVPVDTQLIVR